VDDEVGDGGEKFAKIRPMRVEFYLRGDNSLGDDTRRPLNQVEGRLKKVED